MSMFSKQDYELINLGVCIKNQADRLGIEHDGVPLEGVVVRIAERALAAGVVAEEPEWEIEVTYSSASAPSIDGGRLRRAMRVESVEKAREFAALAERPKISKRRKAVPAGPWVPVNQEIPSPPSEPMPHPEENEGNTLSVETHDERQCAEVETDDEVADFSVLTSSPAAHAREEAVVARAHPNRMPVKQEDQTTNHEVGSRDA